MGFAIRRRGQYIRNTVFLPLKYENIPGYFGLLVFQYKVYNIYYVFLILGYLKENVSQLGNFYKLNKKNVLCYLESDGNVYKLNKKCAIYLAKWLSRIRPFNTKVTIIILFKWLK